MTYCIIVERNDVRMEHQVCDINETHFIWHSGNRNNTENSQFKFIVTAYNQLGKGPLSKPLTTTFYRGKINEEKEYIVYYCHLACHIIKLCIF